MILAVKTRKELHKNSNILLASLAVADFFVGAISLPLSITLDALLLESRVGSFLCRIALANQLVLHASVCLSLYHLTVIAWERYVAIRKYRDYKLIVTKKRVIRCVAISWVLAILNTCLVRVLIAVGVDCKYVEILDLIVSLPVQCVRRGSDRVFLCDGLPRCKCADEK